MAVGFSSSQAWCRTTTHYLWTHCLSQVFITAPVCLCVCVFVHLRKQESCCGLPNKQPGGTFLNRSACLCVSDRKPGGPSKACEWVFYWDKNFRTMPIEKCFSFVVILLYVGYVHCLYAFLNGTKSKRVCECQWNRLADLEESILSDVKRLPFFVLFLFQALLETKL